VIGRRVIIVAIFNTEVAEKDLEEAPPAMLDGHRETCEPLASTGRANSPGALMLLRI
jgi:hypothetical protein